MREYCGSPEAGLDILSASDISGGNNFLSLRKVIVDVGGTEHRILEKMPSARHNLNIRELWLYETFFRDCRIGFVPKFYGSRVEGETIQWVFEFIEEAVHADFREPSMRARILRSLGSLNALQLPPEIPHERTSMAFMNPTKIGRRVEALAEALQERRSRRALMAEFRAALPAHAVRYDRMTRGLGHGDLHRGNMLLGKDRNLYLIDWTRWGEHPVGSDIGKYLLGAAFRNGLPIRDTLQGYAEAVGVGLDDVEFSARYTRIGFLLAGLARAPFPPGNKNAVKELFHHVSAVGRSQ